MSQKTVLHIALKVPFAPFLDYLLPQGCEEPQVGSRVLVKLGNRTPAVGVVLALSNDSVHKKLKPIESVLDESPLLSENLLALLKKTASYYHAPLGEVVHMALPKWFRQIKNQEVPKQYWWKTIADWATAEAQTQRSEHQQSVFKYLQQNQPLTSKEITHICANASHQLKQLEKKGLVTSSELCFLDSESVRTPDFTLTEDQSAAITPINQAQGFNSFLLDGITGSGKTEIYIRLIQKHIEQGEQVLVLVPEIGLTPQLFNEISERITGRMAVLHSGLSDGARARVWQQANLGQVDVVVATRSGIFTPFKQLGMIVVDEEHDLSYKQQDGIRYSARDLALLRGKLSDIPVVLGSATPSMESLSLAIKGQHQWLKLRTRTNRKPLPQTILQNTNQLTLKNGLTHDTLSQIKVHLAKGQQVLVFLNRRGWSPKWMCQDCGWIAKCDDCDAYLTYHKHTDRLTCHHCERRYATPEFCPDCGSQETDVLGVGTERIEAGLSQTLKTETILRFDRDTIKTAKDWQTNLDIVRRGEPCVIVGTQMLAKGHDFPKLSLVVVVNVDNSFYSTDFRATEHLAQLLVQVSGRAGRADTRGEVIIQTQNPTHEFFGLLLKKGYQTFAQEQLHEREAMGFPPYSHMAIIHAQHRDEHTLVQQLQPALEIQSHHPDVNVLGPLPAPIQRKQKMHRMQIIINANSRKALHHYLFAVKKELPAQLRWIVDVDPILLDS